MLPPSHRIATAALLGTLLLASAPAALAQAGDASNSSELIGRVMHADTNGDGQVTRAELLAYRAKQFSRFDRNSNGFIELSDVPSLFSGRFEPLLKQMQAQFDTNHDGRISHDEFVNGPTRGFDLADLNHDGVVTEMEVKTAQAKAKAAHG